MDAQEARTTRNGEDDPDVSLDVPVARKSPIFFSTVLFVREDRIFQSSLSPAACDKRREAAGVREN